MFDISTVGAKVIIKPKGAGVITISRFSDEGTPFESPDVDLSDNRKNLNGEMISSRTPSVYPVSVTVIPNTDEDVMLQKLAQKSALQIGSVAAISDIIIESLTIKVPAIDKSGENASACRTYTWTNGRMKNAPTGPSTSAEGRMSARTYNFEFERYAPAGSVSATNA